MSGLAATLRIARRTARRDLRRSILIAVLVALPVAGGTLVDVLARTLSSPQHDARSVLGVADAEVTVTAWRALEDYRPSPDITPSAAGRPERDPAAVDLAALLPEGTRLARQSTPVPILLHRGDVVLRGDLRIADPREPLQRPFVELVSGRAPRTADEVLVSPALAELSGVASGQAFTDERGVRVTVTGVARGSSCHSCRAFFAREGTVLASRPRGPERHVARFLADLPPGTDADALWPRLARRGVALVPRDAYLHPERYGASQPAQLGLAELRSAALAALIIGLGLLEVVLLAGTAFAVGARRQTRELGLVAAAGGTAAHVRRIVVAQGAVLGLAGAVLGVAAGAGLAVLGRPLWERIVDGDVGPWAFGPWEIAAVAAVGVASGMLAALAPAVGAARMRPIDALAGRLRARRGRAARPALTVALLACGIGLSLLGRQLLAGDLQAYEEQLARVSTAGAYVTAPSPGGPVAFILLGVVALVTAVVVAVPALIGRLAALGSRMPVALRLAVRDGARNRHRTGPATTAVSVAVAGSVTLAFLVAGSSRAQQLQHVPTLPPGVLQVSSEAPPGPQAHSRVQAAALAAAAQLPRPAVLAFRTPDLGPRADAIAVQPGSCADCVSTGPVAVAGDPAFEDLAAGGRLPEAARAGLAEGKAVVFDRRLLDAEGRMRLDVSTAGRPEHLRLPAVAAPRDRVYALLPNALVPQAVLRQHGWRARTRSMLVQARGGAPQPALDRAVLAAERRGADAVVDAGTDYPADVLLAVLAVAAGLVTLAGVAISVALAAAEGRADLATLAAVGAAPSRRRALAAGQALLVGGLGSLLGIAFGTYVALITQSLTGAPDLVVPWANLALTGIVVPLVAVAVAAACTPSRLPLVRRVA